MLTTKMYSKSDSIKFCVLEKITVEGFVTLANLTIELQLKESC